jgi:hypothetical protein
MGNLKSSDPTSLDTEGMFEDAAYWNRYDQTTPWGGVRWNDDRTAMTQYLSPEMQQLMGMQMGMYGGALSEMMAWFGMDPNAFSSFGMPDDGGGGPSDPFPGGGGGDGGASDTIYKDPNTQDTNKSLADSPQADWGPGNWYNLYEKLGMPHGGDEGDDTNWSDSGLVPRWFSETHHGDDPIAFVSWWLRNEDRGGYTQEDFESVGLEYGDIWSSESVPDVWLGHILEMTGNTSEGLPPPRPAGPQVTPDDGGASDTIPGGDGDGDGDGNVGGGGWPWGTGGTGGPFSSWGGRQPEMFWAEDIPSLLWEMDWDAIPDLPTLDQFSEDRERITNEMYTQGLGLLDPYLQEQESKRRQGLADRGIPISAEIGQAEMGDFGRERTKHLGDLTFASTMGGYDEAARQFGLGLGAYSTGLQGEMSRLGMQNQARTQGWNERMGVRSQKWNELASILGMSMMPSQQMGYNFNPSINTMEGYGLRQQNNQFNAGLFNDWMSDIFNSISFV